MIKNVNGFKVEIYDSIQTLPEYNRVMFNSYLVAGTELDVTVTSVEQRLFLLSDLIRNDKKSNALTLVNNIYKSLALMRSASSLKPICLAWVVKSIDGIERPSEEENELLEWIKPIREHITAEELTSILFAVKKKVDTELSTYFPKWYGDDTEVEIASYNQSFIVQIAAKYTNSKEYSPDLLRKINDYFFDLAKPKEIGPDYIQSRAFQFEDLCTRVLLGTKGIDPTELSSFRFHSLISKMG